MYEMKYVSPIRASSYLFSEEDRDCVASESQLHVSDHLISSLCILQLLELHTPYQYKIPSSGRVATFFCDDSDDLKEQFRGSEYLEDFYIHIGHDVLMYNSHRDSLCLFFYPKGAIPEKLISIWDSAFKTHIGEVGLGFGAAGESYGKEIISALPADRFGSFPARKSLK